MALILCPECNAQVSHQAEHCPHCGFPIRQYCAGQLRPTAPRPTTPGAVIPPASNPARPVQQQRPVQQPAQQQRPVQQPAQQQRPVQQQRPAQQAAPQAGAAPSGATAPGTTPEPPKNKAGETFKLILMLLVVVGIAAYFIVPYFTGTTPTDHEVIMGDSTSTTVSSNYDIDEPAPQKKEEAKPRKEEQPETTEPEVAPQHRDTAARPWIKMEPANPPKAKPENAPAPKAEESNTNSADKKTE